MNDIKVTFEIEPIVKLKCMNGTCAYRYINEYSCRLKQITIGEKAQCMEYTNEKDYMRFKEEPT